jgi:hypothetical protein
LATPYLETPLATIEGHEPEYRETRPQAPPASRHILASVVMLAAGFVLTAAVLHLCISDPLRLYAEIRSEKLAIVDQWRGRAGSAAFGSSHVDNGFDPRAFDQELRGTAAQTTSLNLGISGGSQTEQEVVAKAFIDSLPAPAPDGNRRFVLLEITAGANFTTDHLFHPRAINIYNLPTIRLALDDAGLKKLGLRRAAGRSGFAFAAGLLHYTNVGMLSSKIFSVPLNSELFASQTGDDRRGLTPNQLPAPGSPELLADEKVLANAGSPHAQAGEILGGSYTMLRDLATAARKKNVQMIYFVAPRLDDLQSYPTYPDFIQGPLGPVPILNEGQPRLHPELFRAELWHDPGHLTEAGAAVFSKLLADDLKSKLHLTEAPSAPRS